MTNIYERAVSSMPAEHIDNWCSDLYLKCTETIRDLIREYDYRRDVTCFHSAIDGTMWYCIPFAFSPYWIDPHGNY